MLCFLLVAVVVRDVTADLSNSSVPRWLDDYVEFHRKTRGQPGAKYLIYHCRRLCGGIADRLKGVLTVFYAALITRRVFIVDMPWPVSLTTILSPNRIDWRWIDENSEPKCEISSLDIDRTPAWIKTISA